MAFKRKTTLKFILDSVKIHSYKYDYSEVEYFNAKTKVKIICPKHGEFWQVPDSHLRGANCPVCKGNVKKDTTTFIRNAVKLHGDKYDYSKTKYSNARTKIRIICTKHGEFLQSPNSHLSKHGCPKCVEYNDTYSHTVWEKFAKKSKNFDSFKIYIIECWNDEERFYKIGKTFLTVGQRFECNPIPYDWKLVKLFGGNSKYISNLEHILHKKYKDFKYVPEINFSGYTECFNRNIDKYIN